MAEQQSTMPPNPIRVAVLDDYADISRPYFDQVKDAHPTAIIDHHNQTLNPRIPQELDQLVTRLQTYEVIVTMRERTPFHHDLLTRLPKLQLLLTTGMRNAGIDVQTCQRRSITVAGTTAKPSAVPNHSDTNEQTWALILGLAKHVAEQDSRVKSEPRGWQVPVPGPGGLVFGLAGKTLALLGLGKLGTQCAVTGIRGFGMKAVAWSANLTQAKADEAVARHGLPAGSVAVVATKEALVRAADVLSLHLVLGDRSRGVLGAPELALMKPSAVLVNTSRGPLVDEAALLDVLRAGRIRGAALDVFDTEPLPPDSPWRSLDWGRDGRSHVLLSPHAGYIEEETMHWMYKQNAENLARWLRREEVVNVF